MITVHPPQETILMEHAKETGATGKYQYPCFDFTSSVIHHLEKTPSDCELMVSKVLALALPIIAFLELMVMVVLIPLTFAANLLIHGVDAETLELKETPSSENTEDKSAQEEIIVGPTADVPPAPPLDTIVVGDAPPAPPMDAPNPPPPAPPMDLPKPPPFLGAIRKGQFNLPRNLPRKEPGEIQLPTAGFGIKAGGLDAKTLNRDLGAMAKKLKPVKDRALPPPPAPALNLQDLLAQELLTKAPKLRKTPKPVHNRANTATLGALATELANNQRFQQLANAANEVEHADMEWEP